MVLSIEMEKVLEAFIVLVVLDVVHTVLDNRVKNGVQEYLSIGRSVRRQRTAGFQ